MRDGSSRRFPVPALAMALALMAPGCASMRRNAPSPDLRPCAEGFAATQDGWMLGMRHIRPANPDPAKLPVVLCHGLGLNGTFWAITDARLPGQLAARGYEVYVVDMRGSGASHRVGLPCKINEFLQQTPIRAVGGRDWNVDDESRYDVPAILEYVRR